jgi:hypothetical protein
MTPTTTPSLERQDHLKIDGKALLERGTEFSVKGQRGRFRFVDYVQHASGASWINAYGGDRDPRGRRQFRSFDPAHVRTVHRTTELRRPAK